jgi:hypothetical protein
MGGKALIFQAACASGAVMSVRCRTLNGVVKGLRAGTIASSSGAGRDGFCKSGSASPFKAILGAIARINLL